MRVLRAGSHGGAWMARLLPRASWAAVGACASAGAPYRWPRAAQRLQRPSGPARRPTSTKCAQQPVAAPRVLAPQQPSRLGPRPPRLPAASVLPLARPASPSAAPGASIHLALPTPICRLLPAHGSRASCAAAAGWLAVAARPDARYRRRPPAPGIGPAPRRHTGTSFGRPAQVARPLLACTPLGALQAPAPSGRPGRPGCVRGQTATGLAANF